MDEKDKRASTAATRATKPLNPKTVKTHPAQEGDKEGVKSKSESVLLEEAKSELQKLAEQSAANLDGWQRERAEFSNYKRRIERESQLLHEYLTGEIIKKYLVVLDDMDLALKNKPKDNEGAAWAEGILLIERKLQNILESEGIERINQANIPFDANLHEAISNEENQEVESGHIIEVVRQGYKIGDRILRPAMVRVAR
jgi:molecular chaperone GrpE